MAPRSRVVLLFLVAAWVAASTVDALALPLEVQNLLTAVQRAENRLSDAAATQVRNGGGAPTAPVKQAPFPDSVAFLLNMFEQGYGFPRGWNDVLPDGSSFWASQTYIDVGGLTFAGSDTELDSMDAIKERTLTRYGLLLRDGATWEMALSLWGAHKVAYVYESEILYTATTGPAGSGNGQPGGIGDTRADSAQFLYGATKTPGDQLGTITYPGNVTHFPEVDGKPGTPVKRGPGAYFFRFMVPHYQLNDPMDGNYGNAWKYPWPNYDSDTAWNTFGIVVFDDWVPLTGDNIWASIVGPVQALGYATNNNLTNFTCGSHFHVPHVRCTWTDFDTTPPPVQLAISILPALLAMQIESGALLNRPWGTKIFPPDEHEGEAVLLSDNLIALVGTSIMVDVLNNYTANTTDPVLLSARQSFTELKNGLLRFLGSPSIWTEGPNNTELVFAGGHYNTSGFFPTSVFSPGGFSIEAQLLALGVLNNLDEQFGMGFAFRMWQGLKRIVGVRLGDQLCGVGTVAQLPPVVVNPMTTWGSVWTFEAINSAQILAYRYQLKGQSQYAEDLVADAQAMYNQVTMEWPEGLRFPDGSFAFANQRFVVPGQWFANPISSLDATSWSVLQGKNCDPLHWYCGNKPALQNPPSATSRHSMREAIADWIRP